MYALQRKQGLASGQQAEAVSPVPWTAADEQDRQAVQRCRAGDLAAFSGVVERHQEPLMTTAYHILRDREEAADAVQETFLRAYKALESYDGTGRFGAWVGRIGVNVCISMVRARQSRPVTAEESYEAGAADGAYVRLEQNMVLRAALARLSPQDRAVLLLRHVHQLSSAEIGGAVYLPAATVRTRLARALQVVRAALPHLADLQEPAAALITPRSARGEDGEEGA